jgi:phospholipid/cholesterol/gamma-HCH transport system substrate-binding protein
MDDKVNYALVGSFVLVLGTMLVAAVLWLAAGLGSRQAMDTYQAVIRESVAGLNVDAPVKYLGVNVGKVSRIDIDPHNSQQVRLQFLIARGTPIKRDSLAVLKSQGLTGIAYIELSGGSSGSPPLLAGTDGMVPTIPFKLSLSARLESVLSSVLAEVSHVSDNVNALFDADTRRDLKATLADTALLAHTLAGQREAISAGLADAARTTRLTAKAGEQLAPTLARVTDSAKAVQQMADAARLASVQAGLAAGAAASSAQQLGSETLPEAAQLMNELNQLSASMRQLSEQTAGSPNSVLVGKPAPSPGPGEHSTQ